ncbi:MAG: hypothetical protein LBQ73_02725, partial [Tannerellaceae bacterium]|nr:hypothetical protein [Tannerellaceae bacterium]
LGNNPSVRRFEAWLSGESPAERERYYRIAWHASLHQWGQCPKKYRVFLVNLIRHDWQGFLNYILDETVIGELRHPVENADLLKKAFHLLAQSHTKHRVSYNHLSFTLLLAFELRLKVSVLGDQIRTRSFYPEELLDLLRFACVLN